MAKLAPLLLIPLDVYTKYELVELIFFSWATFIIPDISRSVCKQIWFQMQFLGEKYPFQYASFERMFQK